MARMQSVGISATYAGEVILTEAQYLTSDNVALSRSFTTTSEPLVDAESPAIRAFGNAQGEYELEVQVDYGTKAEAMQALLERADFAEEHPTGVLELSVGGVVRSWQAGLSSVNGRLGVSPGGKMRLIFAYSFILGARVEKN